jgi:hypothetical protein
MKSGDKIRTGTGPKRRPLTVLEAESGGLPEPFTAAEWAALKKAAATRPSPAAVDPMAHPLREIMARYVICDEATPAPGATYRLDVAAILSQLIILEARLIEARKRCSSPRHCFAQLGRAK